MTHNIHSKRPVKKKVIFSPSDPAAPDYYLIYIENLDRDFMIKKSSIKQQSNDKVLLSIDGRTKEGEIITTL